MAFPVSSKRVSTSVEGVKTELVLCGYDDSILVVVTQIGKMGTLLSARKEEAYGGGPTYTVHVLMGKRDEPFLVACARQLIENMSDNGATRPLVLSLGLKDHSPVERGDEYFSSVGRPCPRAITSWQSSFTHEWGLNDDNSEALQQNHSRSSGFSLIDYQMPPKQSRNSTLAIGPLKMRSSLEIGKLVWTRMGLPSIRGHIL